jgi:mannosyltransferase
MAAQQTAVNQQRDQPNLSLPPRPTWTFPSTLTLVLLTVAAAALRFFFLTRKPFWFDECFSAEVARLGWHDFIRLLWWREANMSLYYLLLRGWLYIGSASAHASGPFFIRSFSVLASLATLPAIFWLAQELFDRRIALIAVALLSCNAYSVRYAQEARSYSLFLLLATLSSGFFVAYFREQSEQNRRGYILASILAVYAHLCALLLVAAQWLSIRGVKIKFPLGISPGIRRAWIAITVAALPLLAFVGKTGAGPIRWIPQAGAHTLLEYGEHLAGNDGPALLLLYAVACLPAILPLGRRAFRPAVDGETWRIQFLLIWLLFPVALTLLLSLARPVFLARYFIFCLPALIILAAAGVAALRKNWMMGACLAVMLLLSLQGTFSYYDRDFDLERDGSEAAATYVYDHAQPGDAILFHIAEARIPYEFFLSLRNTRDPGSVPAGPEIVFPRHGDHLDYRDVTGNPTSEFLRSVPDKYSRVWVVLISNGTPGHSDASTLMLNQILRESFQQKEAVQFPQVEVRLYGKS